MRGGLMERLGCPCPIIQAPMAGGGDTPALVAAVSGAGGLGSIGAAYLTPDGIGAAAARVRERTSRPFAVNLFAPLPLPDAPANVEAALRRVAPYYAELGLGPPAPPALPADGFAAQFAAALESGASVFSFTFGPIPADAVAAARSRNLCLMGTATTVEEAVILERLGVDAVVAQGMEAGGHRGTFALPFEQALIGTLALVPQVVDAVQVPVIASGGIADGRGLAAALALGAEAAQIGTAFLTCDEAGVVEAYKAAILEARPHGTRLTRAFSGRAARGLVNRVMDEVEAGEDANPAADGDPILPFPLQNALTRPVRAEAARQGRAEYLSLWAGQAMTLARRGPAAALVRRLMDEAEAATARAGACLPPGRDGAEPRRAGLDEAARSWA